MNECVRHRYGAVPGSSAGVDLNEVDSLKRGMNAPFVELVGFDRVNAQQADFSKLITVDLTGTDVR